MGFILNVDALRSLLEIRQEYEVQKQVKLNKKPSLIGMPTLFGGTNVEERAHQIDFIEKMLIILQDKLIHEHDNIDQSSHYTNLNASRMLLAVCLYVQQQITGNCTVLSGKNALLFQLINKKLGITDTNFLDAEDKAICFQTAHAFTILPNTLDEANKKLEELSVAPISFSDWIKFKSAVDQECLSFKTTKTPNHYPFTSITKPLFGTVFAYAGASLGFLGGDVICKSSQLLPTRYYVSAGISGVALTLHTSNPIGISILAPIIAHRLLESFFQVGLGHIGAVTFKILGQGVGTAVGLPLDLAYHLSLKTYSLLKEHYKNNLENNVLGLRIADGKFVVANVAIEVKECTEDSDLEANFSTEIDGKTYVISNISLIDDYAANDSLDHDELEESELLSMGSQ